MTQKRCHRILSSTCARSITTLPSLLTTSWFSKLLFRYCSIVFHPSRTRKGPFIQNRSRFSTIDRCFSSFETAKPSFLSSPVASKTLTVSSSALPCFHDFDQYDRLLWTLHCSKAELFNKWIARKPVPILHNAVQQVALQSIQPRVAMHVKHFLHQRL